MFMNYRGRLALRLGEDNVQEIFGRRNDRNLFEVVVAHGSCESHVPVE